jgi:hypothetical protein
MNNKKYYYKNYTIIKLNNILKKQYNSKYLITIYGDIANYGNTLKECKKIINNIKKENKTI